MHSIAIANRQRQLAVSRERLLRIARTTLAAERVAAAEISIALLDHEWTRDLNHAFLGHDYTTDVISFLLDPVWRHPGAPVRARRAGTRGERRRAKRRGTGKRISGEVVINAEMALERAAEFGWPPRDEV